MSTGTSTNAADKGLTEEEHEAARQLSMSLLRGDIAAADMTASQMELIARRGVELTASGALGVSADGLPVLSDEVLANIDAQLNATTTVDATTVA